MAGVGGRADNRALDVVAVGVTLAMAVAGLLIVVDFGSAPFEDAAILMRYSEHLGHGYGIVWNLGGGHVDGATDFLFMVLAAVPYKLGMSVESSVRMLTVGSHLATVLVVYFAGRRLHRAPVAVCALAAAWVAVGPALRSIEQMFGTPFFGLTVAVAWVFAYRYRATPSVGNGVMFAGAALVMGLTRPEGVLLAGYMVLAVAAVEWREARRLIVATAAVFAVIGGAYFVWRWWYFGYPLPNPYYRKGGGTLHRESLRASIHNARLFLLPVVPLAVIALVRRAWRELAFTAIPIGLFTLQWVLLSNEMNHAGRFQYALIPLAAVSAPRLWKASGIRIGRPAVAAVTVVAAAAALLIYQAALLRDLPSYGADGNRDVALILDRFPTHRLATTEAGLLPLYSGWPTLDTWGLNDIRIAHRGGRLEAGDLRRFNPDVVVFHGSFVPGGEPRGDFGLGPQWTAMTLTMRRFVEAEHFSLSAAFGRPGDVRYFYVRSTLPDCGALTAAIARVRFRDPAGVAVPNLAPPDPGCRR